MNNFDDLFSKKGLRIFIKDRETVIYRLEKELDVYKRALENVIKHSLKDWCNPFSEEKVQQDTKAVMNNYLQEAREELEREKYYEEK